MRGRSLARKQNTRSPKKRFIIFTEGKNTEPSYIAALVSLWDGTLVDLEIVKAAGVPATIANAAIDRLKEIRTGRRKLPDRSFETGDQVWAVFDKDAHPQFLQSVAQCRSAGVGLAYSNPCFELWMILHKSDFDRSDDRHQVQRHLETVCPEYDRNLRKTADCLGLVKSVEEAEQRAIRQAQRRRDEGDGMAAPSTSVHELTAALRAAHMKHVGDA